MNHVTELFIAGKWHPSEDRHTLAVVDPATQGVIGTVAHATVADIDRAAEAAASAFESWSRVSTFERSAILRRAAGNVRERVEAIARQLTGEQGKPLAESRVELLAAADVIEWFAEEGRRAYGRVIPARSPAITQAVYKRPLGPVAAFSPWNFPVTQAVRKIAGALAAGCTIVIKAPEETPSSVAALVQAFADAGVTPGAVNLLFGTPSEISARLIAHPAIRKISFTGSTAVGRELASRAGRHMKPVTMELGGHAPALVFNDADIAHAARVLAGGKYRNAGQVCVAPTRMLVERGAFPEFLETFLAIAGQIVVGSGVADGTTMGPLANERRVDAIDALVRDAVEQGATLEMGGRRTGNRGYFYEPTVLSHVPSTARIMNEEPFGPVAIINRFDDYASAIREANRLSYGLAAYVYTASASRAAAAAEDIESGMVSVNHYGLALPETPFGGVKDSGYGHEGGMEGLDAYLVPKFVTSLHAMS